MKLLRGILINSTSTPKTATDEAGKTYRQTTAKLGPLGLDTAVPESVRSMAENSVDQTRTAYDGSTIAFDVSVATFERSFDAAGHSAVAFSRKVIDIARRNVSSSFDLAKSLAGAKSCGCGGGASRPFGASSSVSWRLRPSSSRPFDQGRGGHRRLYQGACWPRCRRARPSGDRLRPLFVQ
jgi:hypothetical protein